MIENYVFGKFIIAGKEYESNLKIINDKVIVYKHLENHNLLLSDIIDLINAKPSYLIIGTGAYGVIKVKQEIIDFIQKQKIRLIIAKTDEACKKINQLLKENKKVAAFLHNTC